VEYRTELRDTVSKNTIAGDTRGIAMLIFQHIADSKVLVVFKDNGYLAEYDLETRAVRRLAYASELLTCERSCYYGKYVWFTDLSHDAVRRWDYANGGVEVYNGFPKGFESNDGCLSFSVIIDCKSHLLMLPRLANMAVLLDKASGAMCRAESFPVHGDAACEILNYATSYSANGNRRFVFLRFRDTIYEFDIDAPNEVTPHRVTVSESDYWMYIRDAISIAAAEKKTCEAFLLSDEYVSTNAAAFFSKYIPVNLEVARIQREKYKQRYSIAGISSGKAILAMCKSIHAK
jgi:hypothetical protein